MRPCVDGGVGRNLPPPLVRHYPVRAPSRALLIVLGSASRTSAGTGHPRGQVHALRLAGQSVHAVHRRSIAAVSVRPVRQDLRRRCRLAARRETAGRLECRWFVERSVPPKTTESDGDGAGRRRWWHWRLAAKLCEWQRWQRGWDGSRHAAACVRAISAGSSHHGGR